MWLPLLLVAFPALLIPACVALPTLSGPRRATFVDLANFKCPVMGGVAKPAIFTVHHGMKVHFCCSGCDAKFRADPDHYLRVLRTDPDVAKKVDEAEVAWAARTGIQR
jgi:hypothetical protein